MNKEDVKELSEKVVSGTASNEEIQLYNRLCDSYALNDEALDESLYGDKKKLEIAIKKAIFEKARIEQPVFRMKWFKWVAAASVILMISTVSIFIVNNRIQKKDVAVIQSTKQESIKDVAPGQAGAILTLATGQKILLDSAVNGSVAQQGNVSVIKKNGELVYSIDGNNTDVVFNTMTTPKGRQFNLVLADGSKVWLNAASSITFPTAFTGNDRKVAITGEAYFEIAKDASRPFKVQVNQMEVEVLGTHFNINGYADEDVIRTTLLEGSVKINTKGGNSLLKPGQQAQLQKTGRIKLVDNADLEETMAWKDGNFQFENSDINAVMRQITRWYDVDIEYKGTVSKHFLGSISRNVNLSQVLTMLQQTGEVKFLIEDKKVVVIP
jgi:hypothetical protein